jgi:hypothetical protein
MRFGMGVPKTLAERRESRIPMEVRVQITGHLALPGTETTFTQNVSAGGARVWSSRRWKPGDRLTISTLTGSFKSIARVAYCQLIPESGFAVGLEFLEARDGWVIGSTSAA